MSRKHNVILLQSGVDLLGADQVVLGTEDGTGTKAVPNGTVVYDTGKSDSDWYKVRLLSDLHLDVVYAVHEEEGETWYIEPCDVRKRWPVSDEVLHEKLVPKFLGVRPVEQSEATQKALHEESKARNARIPRWSGPPARRAAGDPSFSRPIEGRGRALGVDSVHGGGLRGEEALHGPAVLALLDAP